MPPASPGDSSESVAPSAPLFGVLSRAGAFAVGSEEVTGLIVSCEREGLARAARLPMYRSVVVIEVQAWLDQATKLGLAIGALESLSSQVDTPVREKIEDVIAQLVHATAKD